MAKAKTRDSTPPTNTFANYVTASDPVIALTNQLFDLWNADDAFELQYRDSSGSLTPAGEIIQKQTIEWRQAVTHIISFTRATSLAGALVQLAIALDEFDALDPVEAETRKQRELHELRISRLITSAMRAVHNSLGAEVESVRAFVEIYQIDDGYWLEDVPRWAAEGRAARLESERESIEAEATAPEAA